MTYVRILAMVAVLIAVFVLGMSLTAAQLPFVADGFPLNRKFIAVSLNAWNGDVEFPSGQKVAFKAVVTTRMACPALSVEGRYLGALLKATRWRTEDRTLILENDADILRFHLAPH
jgi:hypothetical protein